MREAGCSFAEKEDETTATTTTPPTTPSSAGANGSSGAVVSPGTAAASSSPSAGAAASPSPSAGVYGSIYAGLLSEYPEGSRKVLDTDKGAVIVTNQQVYRSLIHSVITITTTLSLTYLNLPPTLHSVNHSLLHSVILSLSLLCHSLTLPSH